MRTEAGKLVDINALPSDILLDPASTSRPQPRISTGVINTSSTSYSLHIPVSSSRTPTPAAPSTQHRPLLSPSPHSPTPSQIEMDHASFDEETKFVYPDQGFLPNWGYAALAWLLMNGVWQIIRGAWGPVGIRWAGRRVDA